MTRNQSNQNYSLTKQRPEPPHSETQFHQTTTRNRHNQTQSLTKQQPGTDEISPSLTKNDQETRYQTTVIPNNDQ